MNDLTGLETLQAVLPFLDNAPNIGKLLGMKLESLEEGRVSFSLTSEPNFANPLGVVHGGICATLLDSVMGCAVHSALPAGVSYTTLELKVNYIASVSVQGVKLTATGQTKHLGRSTATAEGEVRDETGRLIAHASTTCLIKR